MATSLPFRDTETGEEAAAFGPVLSCIHSGNEEDEEKDAAFHEGGGGEGPLLHSSSFLRWEEEDGAADSVRERTDESVGERLSMRASAAVTRPSSCSIRRAGGRLREAEKEKKCVVEEEADERRGGVCGSAPRPWWAYTTSSLSCCEEESGGVEGKGGEALKEPFLR